MPHKRNPIMTERITGIARLLRGYAQTGLEDVALWHERDITTRRSSGWRCPTRRPCSTTPSTWRSAWSTACGQRRPDGENLELTHGALYSQRALLALVEAGHPRDDAYRIVQEAAQRALDEGRIARAAGRGRAGPGSRRRVRPAGLRAPRPGLVARLDAFPDARPAPRRRLRTDTAVPADGEVWTPPDQRRCASGRSSAAAPPKAAAVERRPPFAKTPEAAAHAPRAVPRRRSAPPQTEEEDAPLEAAPSRGAERTPAAAGAAAPGWPPGLRARAARSPSTRARSACARPSAFCGGPASGRRPGTPRRWRPWASSAPWRR